MHIGDKVQNPLHSKVKCLEDLELSVSCQNLWAV